MILVTGGAGFIGSNFVLEWLAQSDEPVVNVDKLTYAGNLNNLASLRDDTRHVFVHADICDSDKMQELLSTYKPTAIVHFAAESHVDRSIHGPAEFVRTNINGTFSLLEAARTYWAQLATADKEKFRFLHVSTDEVYGTLGPDDAPFSEATAYAPNSPYSASKAASDHLVRSYHHTYGLPTDSTHYRQCAGGKIAPYLWRRTADSRLVVCWRSLHSDPSRATSWQAGRNLQYRRLERKGESGCGAYPLRYAGCFKA